jgi:hypothetical protein
MRIILHLDAKQAEFRTDKAGDLHIFAKGLEPDLRPLPRKRGRKPRAQQPPMQEPTQPGVPYTEPSADDKNAMRQVVLDEKGWQ